MSWKRQWRALAGEELPKDVLPCSNGEFEPGDPTRDQRAVMELQNREVERMRGRFDMSRRDFVRSAAAFTIGIWAIGQVMPGRFGRYAFAETRTDSCDDLDLEWPGAQMDNLPGEFIFDVQSHHVDPEGMWRVTNPALHAFFAGIWSQSGPTGGVPGIDDDGNIRGFGGGGEVDPIENLSRFHYLKELYLDSSTNMCVLSAVPSEPDNQPLPIHEAARTVESVNLLANGTQRAVMHSFVMPNRGSIGTSSDLAGVDPIFLNEEMEMMEERAQEYHHLLGGWKIYTAWGDVPYASGWYMDDRTGRRFMDQVRHLGDTKGTNKVIAVHKGFALPGFDQRAASPREIGVVARDYPDVKILVYHSGHDGETVGPYPGDDNVSSSERTIDALCKSLRENGWDASRFVEPGFEHGNVPNVWGELGSVWSGVDHDPDQSAHALGKLITHVGPRRVAWGTDSLWFGSPQSEIVTMRAFEFTEEGKELYNLPYGLEGDRFDPRRNTKDPSHYRGHPDDPSWPQDGVAHPERSIRNGIFGRNAAEAYGIDPDERRERIHCDDVQEIKRAGIVDAGTAREREPFRTNQLLGARDNKTLWEQLNSEPWSP